jgi:uncharacterized membrane protein YeaQ/YmgE (transglycosylase-associated protein family)
MEVHRAAKTAANSYRKNKGGNQMEYGIIAWLVVGAIAGWLAGQVVKGGGFGLIVDIIVGIVGALIGGFLAGVLGISTGGGIIASIIVAFIGAVILLFILRLIKRA